MVKKYKKEILLAFNFFKNISPATLASYKRIDINLKEIEDISKQLTDLFLSFHPKQ